MKAICKKELRFPNFTFEVYAASENGIEQARMPEYPANILSPKEYGMKLMKRKRNK